MPLNKSLTQIIGSKLLVGSQEYLIQNETTYRYENQYVFGNYKKIISQQGETLVLEGILVSAVLTEDMVN